MAAVGVVGIADGHSEVAKRSDGRIARCKPQVPGARIASALRAEGTAAVECGVVREVVKYFLLGKTARGRIARNEGG